MSKPSPHPWRWKEPLDETEMPVLLDANGDVVCHFGDSAQFYPIEGDPPGPADAALLELAPELAEALRKARDEIEEQIANEAPSSALDAWLTDNETLQAVYALLARLDEKGGPG